jgi:hypothetical protein
MRFVILLLLISSASFAGWYESAAKWNTAPWQKPTPVEISLHIVAEVSIMFDVWSTYDIKNFNQYGQRCNKCFGLEETMPLLGLHPGDFRITYVGLTSVVLTTALWYALPQQVRWMVDVGVLIVEVPVVRRNFTVHGLRLTIPFN